jgi:hypothetical protein
MTGLHDRSSDKERQTTARGDSGPKLDPIMHLPGRVTVQVVFVSGIHGLLFRGPWLEREEQKGNPVKDRKAGEYAPIG